MTKEELKETIRQDLARYNGRKPGLRERLFHNESWFLYHIVVYVRYMEYHKGGGGINSL